ncbi:glucosamine inositolphosphorylceramide transferase family protein [Kaistia defluvii]|uniref:Glucosamine inositolphosphorylceramide transferase 1 N-terminal domain-containing protein n=1 Tax=Kaistia defluvii TaxID=410841 RepID=A0ABV2QU92_9HYPH
MRIDIRLDPAELRGWQVEVVAGLRALPECEFRISKGRATGGLPKSAETLFWLERTLFHAEHGALATHAGWPDLPIAEGDWNPDLRIDLCGDDSGDGEADILTIRCDGEPLEAGALAAVLDERTPCFETVLAIEGASRVLSVWRPAVENPRSATAALGMLLGRAAHMLVHDAARLVEGIPAGTLAAAPVPPKRNRSAAGFLAASLSARVQHRIERQLGRAPNWFVAWRERTGGDELPVITPSGFRRLADDGQRFYADPFLWEHDGKRYLFVEEFPYATGKGVLSLSEIDGDGKIDRPRVIFETDCHLSYPFLFEHEGAHWMIPETSARRTVELYRADPFPDRWTLHSVLLENVDLGDATLQKVGDIWWMFASSRERWTSSWDALSLYRAPSPFGPWEPHPGNPVMVDLHAARPAGRILEIGGRLVRPVQNCDGLYGAALGFAEIRTLTSEAYAQTLSAMVLPWGDNTGLHTFNRSASLEVIDLFGPRG